MFPKITMTKRKTKIPPISFNNPCASFRCVLIHEKFCKGCQFFFLRYIYIQFFIGLPAELEDAAYVDGAGPIRTFLSIVLPSSSVVILTVSVLSFIWHWNETYLSALCLLDENWPLSVQMMNIKQKLIQAGMFLESTPEAGPIVFCACLLFIIIPLVLYLIIQRKFVTSIDRVGITG